MEDYEDIDNFVNEMFKNKEDLSNFDFGELLSNPHKWKEIEDEIKNFNNKTR